MKKLISIIITLSFCLTTTGMDLPLPLPKNTLRPQSFALSGNIKRIRLNEGFGFEVEKLPDDELKKLRRIKKINERIIAARKARGMEKQSQLIEASSIPGGTVSYIESTDTIPTFMNLRKLCQALRLDPFLITEAKEWDEVKDRAKTDCKKMRLSRSRKCWSQEEAIKHIEDAGVEFETKKIDSKRTRYTGWETGNSIPYFGDKIIIAKVLGDDTLFNVPEEFKGDIELNIMPGLAINAKVGFYLAFYWKQIRGHTPAEADNIMSLRKGSVSNFLKMYGRKKIAEYYGIDLSVKPKPVVESKRIRPIKEKKEGWKYLPEPANGKIADYFAEHWQELEGLQITRTDLARRIGVSLVSIRNFFKRHPKAAAYYKIDISYRPRARKSKAKTPTPKEGPRFVPGVNITKMHRLLAEHWKDIAGLTMEEIAEKYGVNSASLSKFFQHNEGAKAFYGIKFNVNRLLVSAADEKKMKFLPGIKKTGIAYFFAKNWKEIDGLTVREIADKFAKSDKITFENIRNFLKNHKKAWEFYNIKGQQDVKKEKVHKPKKKRGPKPKKVKLKEKEEEGMKFMPGIKKTRIACFFAKNWQGISGLTVWQIVDKFGESYKITYKNIIGFLKRHNEARAFYNIKREKEVRPQRPPRPKPTPRPRKEKPKEKEEEDMKFLPGNIRKTKVAYFLAKNWKEIDGLTVREIVDTLGESNKITYKNVIGFLKRHKEARAFYNIKREKKPAAAKETPVAEKPIEAVTKGETEEKKTIAAETRARPPRAQRKKSGREKPSIIRDAVDETARYGLTAEEAESGIPDKDQSQISAERLFKMIAYIDSAFALIEGGTKYKYATEGSLGGVEKIFVVGTEDDDYYYNLYMAYDVYKNLKLPEDGAHIGREEIEEAIDMLDEVLEYGYKNIEGELSKEPVAKIYEDTRKLWKATIYLRQVLKLLSVTMLCDWDNKGIRGLAYGLTKGMVEDSDKAKSIEKWVRENIGFSLGYGGYWDARASETVRYKRGMSFNRANLIIAMLRSLGIPARYKIMSFDKELFGDSAEHIVAQAFIEDRWVSLASEIFIKNAWIDLKDFSDQEIGESKHAYEIETLASEEAKKEDHAERDRMEDFRLRHLNAYNPDNIVKTFAEREGLIPWKDIPSIWFESDVKALAQELLKRVNKVKIFVTMLSLHDFKEPVFETSSKKGASLSGLLEFVKEKYGYETESEAFDKIKEIIGIGKNGWAREDWGEVIDTLRSICKDEDMERVHTPKELEEYLYSHTVREYGISKLVVLIDHGKGNKAAFMAVMMASYKQIEDYIYDYCMGFPNPIDIDELKHRIIERLSRELLTFDSSKQLLSTFINDLMIGETNAFIQEDDLKRAQASKAMPYGESKAQAAILESA